MPEPRFYWVRQSDVHQWHQIRAEQVWAEQGRLRAAGRTLCREWYQANQYSWPRLTATAPAPELRCMVCERLHPSLEASPDA